MSRPPPPTFWGLVLALAVPGSLHADIQLAGIVGGPTESQFLLISSDPPSERWVKIGDDFVGFTVSSFDAVNERLVLERHTQRTVVSLRPSRVGLAPISPALRHIPGLQGEALFDELLRVANAWPEKVEGTEEDQERAKRERELIQELAAELRRNLNRRDMFTSSLPGGRSPSSLPAMVEILKEEVARAAAGAQASATKLKEIFFTSPTSALLPPLAESPATSPRSDPRRPTPPKPNANRVLGPDRRALPEPILRSSISS